MKGKRASGTTHSRMVMVHPNAAAIDIGSTMHVAAVGADRRPSRCAASALLLAICTVWLIGSRNVVLRRSSWN